VWAQLVQQGLQLAKTLELPERLGLQLAKTLELPERLGLQLAKMLELPERQGLQLAKTLELPERQGLQLAKTLEPEQVLGGLVLELELELVWGQKLVHSVRRESEGEDKDHNQRICPHLRTKLHLVSSNIRLGCKTWRMI
jgi:hypothetical protein